MKRKITNSISASYPDLIRVPGRMKENLLKKICLILFVLSAAVTLKAQTPTFESQAIATSGTGTTVPFYYSTSGIRSQILYSPAVFTGIASPRYISTIYFVSTSATGAWVFANLQISLGQPNVSALTNSAYVTGLTPVITATNYTFNRVANGWTAMTLDAPFLFDPSKPLVLEVNASHVPPGSPSWNVRAHAPTIAGCYRNWSTSYNTAAPSSADQSAIPIIGFDFKSMTPNDIGLAKMTPALPVCGGASLPVNVRLTNFGNNQVFSGAVNWELNGALQSPVMWSSLLDTFRNASNNPADTAITLTTLSVVAGTTYTIRAWSSSPNGMADPNTTNDTIVYVIKTGLSGAYTIGGTSPDYAAIGDALSDLKTRGVCGPVTFDVRKRDSAYKEQLLIAEIAGSSPTNTVRFNGHGATVSNVLSPVVSFVKATNVTWDSLNVTVDAAATAGFGIYVGGQSRYVTISNSVINVGTASTSSSYAGIVVSGSTTSATTAGNAAQYLTITNNTVIGGYYNITLVGNTGYLDNYGHYIANNKLRDAYYYGFYIANADSTTITNNDISNADRASVSTTCYGMYFTTSRFCKINGNRIHDLTGVGSAVYPISFSNCVNTAGFETQLTNNMIYNMKNTSTLYGIYAQTTAFTGFRIYHNMIDLKVPSANTGTIRGFHPSITMTNVEFKNNIINITGAGTGVKTGIYVTTTSTTFTSNNNDINVAAIAGTGLNYVGYWSATRTSLADWRTASSQDANSVSVDPIYTDTAISNYTPMEAQLDNAGAPTSMLLDINGNPRSSTTPDIGALEFTIPVCQAPPVAGRTLSNKSTACVAEPFVLRFDTVTSTGIGQTYQWELSTDSVGPYSSLTGLTDRIATTSQEFTNWYRVALTCSGFTSYTIPVKVFTYSTGVPASLTIDTTQAISSTNYHSFTALTSDLKCRGISGPTTITFAPHNRTYDGGAIAFDSIRGMSAANPIIIHGRGNTISSAVSPVVSFTTARYITWDSLNVTHTAGTGYGMYITNRADHITITGSVINVGTTSTSTTNAGIVVAGSPTSPTTVGNNGQFITIENNKIIGGYYGVTLIGNASYLNNTDNIVRNNIVTDFYAYGIYVVNGDGIIIEKNDINRATRATLTTLYGVYMGTSRFVKINANSIHATGPGTYASNPIYIVTSVNTTGFESEITNNLIYDIPGSGTFYGIYGLTTSFTGFKIYHNTISYEVPSASTSAVRGFWAGVAPNNVEFKNNIINITGAGTGVKTGIYITTNSASFASNFNDIYVNAGSAATNYVGYWTATRAALTDWQTASSQDANSVALNPAFSSATNVTPLSGSIDNLGTPVGVLVDAAGNPRSASTPDLGGIEFVGTASDVSLEGGMLIRSGDCYSANDTVKVTVRNVFGTLVDFSVTPVTVVWQVTGPVNSSNSIAITSGTLAVGSALTVFDNTVNRSAYGDYTLKAFLVPNAVNNSAVNDTIKNIVSNVKRILTVSPKTVTVNSSASTVNLSAQSPMFPGGSVFFSEIAHYKVATGAPTAGWPAYMITDDYVELTGVANSDLAGFTMEEWSGTTLQHTVTFPAGTVFSPNGTMILATGQLGSSVPVPASFYYHTGNTFSHSSTGDNRGYLIKDPLGVIVDATVYGTYTFPVASGVTAADWSGNTPAVSSSGNRLNAPDNNTPSSWINSGVSPQDPNTLNAGLSAPVPGTLTGFNWSYLGGSISTVPGVTVGPYTTPGVYAYVASWSNTCGTFYDTAYVTASSSVPVKLVSFKAAKAGDDVVLSWSTASEVNSDRFEIERSADGKTFGKISEVDAAGTSVNAIRYNITDASAFKAAGSNTLIYRLKMMDNDGTFEYSDNAVVNIRANKEKAALSIFPNPYSDKTYLQVNGSEAAAAKITITDITGKVIVSYNETIPGQSSVLELRASEMLRQGVYFVSVEMNGEVKVMKLIRN